MKITIPITICDKKSEDLGIEIDEKLIEFHFDSIYLIGYWVDMEDEGIEIKIYIGSDSFLTPYNKEIINLLESILNKSR